MSGDRFLNDLDGYLAWAKDNFTSKGQWCARHWAPCPTEGRNGIVASILMMQKAVGLMPSDVQTPAAMNSWMANLIEPICCKLGDEAMAEIWAEAEGGRAA